MLARIDDEKVALCLLRLSGPEFSPLVEWLNQSKEVTVSAVVDAQDEVALRQLQGGARLIKDLLNEITNARVLVTKFKR